MVRKKTEEEEIKEMLEPKEKSELEQAMELIKALSAKVAALEGEKEPEVPTARLDIMKPYMTIRTEGAVTYEQFGKKYDGKKRLIED